MDNRKKWFRTVAFNIILLTVILIISLPDFFACLRMRNAMEVFNAMSGFYDVSQISIEMNSEILIVINDNYCNFEDVKSQLHPFQPPNGWTRLRYAAQMRRLSCNHMVITYSTKEDILFVINVFLFSVHPSTKNVNPHLVESVFAIKGISGALYGIALINDSNFVANFRLETLNMRNLTATFNSIGHLDVFSTME